jgi:hypothetical protein
VVGEAADDLIGFRAIERPGLAEGAEDGDLHGNGSRQVLDGELKHAVGGLRFLKDLAELDARIDVLESLPVDRLDDLAFFQPRSLCR